MDYIFAEGNGREITGKDKIFGISQLAKQAADNAPDVRAELVNPLKERIANGTYEVSTEDFASRLLSKYNGLF